MWIILAILVLIIIGIILLAKYAFIALCSIIAACVILVSFWKKWKELNKNKHNAIDKKQTLKTYVFISPNGKKYHHDPACAGLKNCVRVDINEAKAKGYTECNKCHYY